MSAARRGTGEHMAKKTTPVLWLSGVELLPKKKAARIEASVRRLVKRSGIGPFEVSIALIRDSEMAELNAAHRGKEGPTDVLSFAALEGEFMPGTEHLFGDIVVSVDTARRQAKVLGHSLRKEVCALVAHGLMHLAGWDHERGPEEARQQAECEMALLDRAGLKVTCALGGRGL